MVTSSNLSNFSFELCTGVALETVGENESDVDEEEDFQMLFDEAQKKTKSLALAARKEMLEMQKLLDKEDGGTATRMEISRLQSLRKQMVDIANEIKESKTEQAEAELGILRSKTRKESNNFRRVVKERDLKNALKNARFSESVDVAFVIDCTGSMHVIAEVKNNIREIVKKIQRTNPDLNLRLAVVGYRDFGDKDPNPHFEILDFVKSVGMFEEFLSSLVATGGDDAPEDMAGAIQKANNLSWEQGTRVVFVIADAPCHGTEFHTYGTMGDNYPEGSPGVDIKNEFRTLLKNRASNGGTMTVNFCRITDETDVMVKRLKTAEIHLEIVSLDDPRTLSMSITKGVRASIFKTMTLTSGNDSRTTAGFFPAGDIYSVVEEASGLKREGKKRVQIKNFCIDTTLPSVNEWKRQEAVPVTVYQNLKIPSLASLQAPTGIGMFKFTLSREQRTDRTKNNTMFMRCAGNPFAEGEVRIAYHGQLSHEREELEKEDNAMVMKSFKHVGKGVNERDQYLKQMEVSTIARYLAQRYNETFKPSHCSKIIFLPVCVVENEITGDRFCAERPLPNNYGAFAKYSNNTGYWNEEDMDETLVRFTAFSFWASDEYLMVTDLQGVKSNGIFYLTDPVILCKDVLRFGHTNLGELFMSKCMQATQAIMEENGWE